MSHKFKAYTIQDTYKEAIPLLYPNTSLAFDYEDLTIKFIDLKQNNKVINTIILNKDEFHSFIREKKEIIALNILRNIRTYLLKNADIYTLPDYPHPNEDAKNAWLEYRQALRDLPSQVNTTLKEDLTFDPYSVPWPAMPI